MGNNFHEDINSNYICLIGAKYHGSSIRPYFNGFLWELRIYNTEFDLSSLLQSSGCSGGCTYCPINNSNECLPTCDIDEHWDESNNSCKPCHSNCQEFGCVRNDSSCNLCYDEQCNTCKDFSSCDFCKSGHYKDGPFCQPCDVSCKECSGSNSTQCTECESTKILTTSSTCESTCRDGEYQIASTTTCEACDGSCSKCTGPSDSECTECDSGSSLKLLTTSGKCQSKCPDGEYEDTTATPHVCASCDMSSTSGRD